MIPTIVACLTLLAAADPAAPEGAGARPAPAAGAGQLATHQPEELLELPPGTPADQQLWRSGNELSEKIVIERAMSTRLQWNGRNHQYTERLEALSKGGDAAKARAAGELLERYRAVQVLNWTTATRQWPVDPTRGCRYAALDLQGVMYSAEAPRKASQLAVMRDALRECVEKGEPALKVMADLNRDLKLLQEAAEALLPPLAPATHPAAAGKVPVLPAAPAAGK